MAIKHTASALAWLYFLVPAALPVRAELISVSVSGRVTINNTGDTTIPVGTPWTFELIYNTAAPDQDPLLTHGIYNNSTAIPALTFFHYRAGSYEVTFDDPGDFGTGNEITISFGGTHAMDINLNNDSLFPRLAGAPVRFHADFGDFSPSIFTSDALPTDTSLGPEDFDDASVTLIAGSRIVLGSLQDMTSFTINPVPEPSTCGLVIMGFAALVAYPRRGSRRGRFGTLSECGRAD
jgi:hypothetical protein